MAANSGRFREVYAPAHTGSGRDPSDTSYRVAKRSSNRSLARLPCPQVPQCHPGVAKGVFWPVFGTATLPTGTSVESRRGEGGLLTDLRHGNPAHRCSRGISAWQRGLLAGLRHGSPAHRYLSAISAWRRGSSGWSSARQPHPQVPQWQHRGATVSWCIG